MWRWLLFTRDTHFGQNVAVFIWIKKDCALTRVFSFVIQNIFKILKQCTEKGQIKAAKTWYESPNWNFIQRQIAKNKE